MIRFTLSDLHTVEEILRVHDELQSAVERLGLLDWESRPESDCWRAACLVGEVQIMVEDDDMIGAALLLPKAVRWINDLDNSPVPGRLRID